MGRFINHYKNFFLEERFELWKKCENDWKSIVGSNTSSFYDWFRHPMNVDFEEDEDFDEEDEDFDEVE